MSMTVPDPVTSTLATLFAAVSDRLATVLDEGDLDDASRARLGALYRWSSTAAAELSACVERRKPLSTLEQLEQDARVAEEEGGIGRLDLDRVTFNTLRRSGAVTIADLAARVEDGSVLSSWFIGPKRAAEIADALGAWRESR